MTMSSLQPSAIEAKKALEAFILTSKLRIVSDAGIDLAHFGKCQEKIGSLKGWYPPNWRPADVSVRLLNFGMAGFKAWYESCLSYPGDNPYTPYARIVCESAREGYELAREIIAPFNPDVEHLLDQTLFGVLEGMKIWEHYQRSAV